MTADTVVFVPNPAVYPLDLRYKLLDLEYEDRPLFEGERHFAYYTRSGGTVLVPPGFRTDFASIPWIARLFALPDSVQERRAAVIHDAGCQSKALPRADVDRLFYEALLDSGVGKGRAWFYYRSVRLFNGSNWHRNDAKSRGEMERFRELCRTHRGGFFSHRLDFTREPFAFLEAAA